MWIALVVACRKDNPDVPVDPDGNTEDSGDTEDTEDTEDTGDLDPPLSVADASAALGPIVETVVRVSWQQSGDAAVHVEFSFDDDTLASPVRTLAAGAHEELLLGVPYDTDVTWRIVAVGAEDTVTTDDLEIRTPPLPEGAPVPDVLFADPAGYDASQPWLLVSLDTFTDGAYTQIVDRKGRVVWSLRSPAGRWTGYPQLSVAGDTLLVDHNSLFGAFDGGAAGTVVEMTIDGAEIHTFPTPGLHQSFAGLPDGSIAYQRALDDPNPDDTYYNFEDLTQVARDDTTTVLFDCNAWLDGLLPGVGCSGNTVWHDPATGNLLLTEYTAETTVELDATTFEPLRWFGSGYVPGGWTYDPPESAMVYPHNTHYTEGGTLLVSDFDDRVTFERVLVREYAVDFATETLTEIFVTVAPPEVFGIGFGAASRLPNGNTQQNCGMSRLREVTPENELVWDVFWPRPGSGFMLMGLSTPLADLYPLAPDRP
ncbi:MAG: hypothetical protein ABMB14_00710 [Myxococcota bacterium]